MSKTLVKIYFNNGCATLLYNEQTTVEELIRNVIKGRLSLNELRYKQCFHLRATRLAAADDAAAIEEFRWLPNSLKIKQWLQTVDEGQWRLQLRVRFLPPDLNEVKFKDRITFNYYYEQVKNDFVAYGAAHVQATPANVSLLVELGCLEMRRSFLSMTPNTLSSSVADSKNNKITFEFLEKELGGLKRFFPDFVLQHSGSGTTSRKSGSSFSNEKAIKKAMKSVEQLNEDECMLRYLEKLLAVHAYHEETYKCHLDNAWLKNVSIVVTVNATAGLSCHMKNVSETEPPFQRVSDFGKIVELVTEEKKSGGSLLKLKFADEKEPLTFDLESMAEADNLASLVEGYCYLFDKTRAANLWQRHVINNDAELSEQLAANVTLDDEKKPAEPEDELKSLEIRRDSLQFHDKIGSGQFGDVFRGTYQQQQVVYEVAIKKLKVQQEADKFMHEARMMRHFDHPNIIKLIGICSQELIVMELAKFGQLKTYLQANRDQIDSCTLLLYCYQLSAALAYLETKRFVHRDVAARNVLVVNHECVKLADFGLALREEGSGAAAAGGVKLPIKWMAPESIQARKFTSKSDVWMFGICMWEVLSFGAKPFDGIKNVYVIRLIEERHRLAQPPRTCPDELYSVLLSCWEYESALRPTFQQLQEILRTILVQQLNRTQPKPPPQPPAAATTTTTTQTGMAKSPQKGAAAPSPGREVSEEEPDDDDDDLMVKKRHHHHHHHRHHQPSRSKDLVLRDQTLNLIKKVSVFIQVLNTSHDSSLADSYLSDVQVALLDLVKTAAECSPSNNNVDKLERNFRKMSDKLTNNDSMESVINVAIELARAANELFLAIVKSSPALAAAETSSIVTKANNSSNSCNSSSSCNNMEAAAAATPSVDNDNDNSLIIPKRV